MVQKRLIEKIEDQVFDFRIFRISVTRSFLEKDKQQLNFGGFGYSMNQVIQNRIFKIVLYIFPYSLSICLYLSK